MFNWQRIKNIKVPQSNSSTKIIGINEIKNLTNIIFDKKDTIDNNIKNNIIAKSQTVEIKEIIEFLRINGRFGYSLIGDMNAQIAAGKTGEKRFNHDDIGWNYRMTNLQASIGYGQLKNISWIIKRKREIGRRYISILKKCNKNSIYFGIPAKKIKSKKNYSKYL